MTLSVVCADLKIPRIDGKGFIDNLTEGKEYEALYRRNHFYYLINDEGKKARYLVIRFTTKELNKLQ